MIHVVYRAAASSNNKRRPAFFSKGTCLASLLMEAELTAGTRLTFVWDGPLDGPLEEVLRSRGEVIVLGGRGNAGSYRFTVRRLAQASLPTEHLYLCEDDYLQLPGSLDHLDAGLLAVGPGAYLTPYDHPDRYRRLDDHHLDPSPKDAALTDRGWRRVESMTMTYATTGATLRDDALVHLLAAARHYPRDRQLWWALQGLGPFGVLGRRRRRLLFGAVPGQACHVEDGQLAPGADWEARAVDARVWAEANAHALAGRW